MTQASIDERELPGEAEAWQRLHAAIDRVTPEMADEVGYFEEGWTAKDAIGHLGAWMARGATVLRQIAAGTYRARLSAFMVTIGKSSASAEPLYPVKGGGVGFQTASASKLMANDQSVVFSRLATSVAESQASASGKKGKSSLFGRPA